MLNVFVNDNHAGAISKEGRDYIFGYSSISPKDFVSLTMPVRLKSYIYPKSYIHPIFEMNLPEGYLFELFKELLKKDVESLDDLTLLSALAPNIHGRLTYKTQKNIAIQKIAKDYTLDEIVSSKDDIFKNLLDTFLADSAVSGIQPKVLAELKDKTSLNTKEYIIKSFGSEFPNLCENEYFCLKAAQKAGLDVPNFKLSENKKLLIIERFTNSTKEGKKLGFEEVCTLMGKNRTEKYTGSYEQVAKSVKTFVSVENQAYSLEQLYKNIAISYIMRNGDAHLKNFGILYHDGAGDVIISPAYDIITTVCYIYKDKPALTLEGKKIWWDKKTLLNFGQLHCNLTAQKAKELHEQCENALAETKKELEAYIRENKDFEKIGKRMLYLWEDGLQGELKKEIELGSVRGW